MSDWRGWISTFGIIMLTWMVWDTAQTVKELRTVVISQRAIIKSTNDTNQRLLDTGWRMVDVMQKIKEKCDG